MSYLQTIPRGEAPKPDFELLHPHLEAGHDLIPLKPLSKMPLHAGWPSEIPLTGDQASAHMAKGRNIGVRLRPDMLVIDVDPRRAPEGSRPIEELESRLGLHLSSGPLVLTGGGGQHLYFRKPADLAVRGSLQEFPAIEFKSAGAQVLASGSVHPITREHYRSEFLLDDFAAAPEAPSALLDLIAKRAADTVSGQAPSRGHGLTGLGV